jgi:hypothetical protein
MWATLRFCSLLLWGLYVPQEHEMFDHPVAMLIVAVSTEEDPIARFKERSESHEYLPPPFHSVGL